MRLLRALEPPGPACRRKARADAGARTGFARCGRSRRIRVRLPAFLTVPALVVFLTACAAAAALEIRPGVTIAVDPGEPPPVHRAVDDLRRDLEKVFGMSSPIVSPDDWLVTDDSPTLVVAGPESRWPGLALSDAVEGWESHAVYVREKDGTPHVVLHGGDMRGTIYAIYTFSEEVLGIPPLWLWASWEPESRETIEVPRDFDRHFDPPHVRWRAWFPMGQTQLTPWRNRSREKHDAYAETMLRLKLNCLDMLSFLHGGFTHEYRLHPNAEMAKRYGLAVTATHTAPLGAHPDPNRWRRYWERIRGFDEAPARSIHDKNSLFEYWKYHIEAARHHDLEVIWPIAFRGAGDVAFWERDNFEDPGTDELRAEVIEEMLREQVALLKSVTGDNNPAMRITLYNEKSDFLARGLLELPREPGLIYNFVAARRDHFPPPDLLTFEFPEDQLTGYYFNYQFVSTGSFLAQGESPWKMERNFRTVDSLSPTGLTLSVVNAGNIREHVMELAANAAMMWDFDAYESDEFLRAFCALYFGAEAAGGIAELYRDFYDAYWRQREPDLDGFPRQYLFQDLRLHRAMRILVPKLKEREADLNPFWSGDWFRIDPAAQGAETEVEALVRGMRQSIDKLKRVNAEADAWLERLPEPRRTFFNDNLRVQARFLQHASEVVHHLGRAMIDLAKDRDIGSEVERADRAVVRMIDVLSETEHGIFAGWYEPRTHFHLHERREEIAELLASTR